MATEQLRLSAAESLIALLAKKVALSKGQNINAEADAYASAATQSDAALQAAAKHLAEKIKLISDSI